MGTRAAGGLLVGIALHPISSAFGALSFGTEISDVTKQMLWWHGDTPPGNTVAFIIIRDVLLLGGLLVAGLTIAGLRPARLPVVVVSALIAIGITPWVIYDARSIDDNPPDFVLENQLWYPLPRWTALIWLLVCVAAVALAAADRSAAPSRRHQSYAPVPQSPPPIVTPPTDR